MSLGGRTARRHKKRGVGPGGPDLRQRGGDLMGVYSTFRNGLADTIDSGANFIRSWLPEPIKKLTRDSGVYSILSGGVEEEVSGGTMGGGRRRR